MRYLWIAALFCTISCGDSEGGGGQGGGGSGGSSPGELEWEISYSGDLSGTVDGPICTVTGDNGIITIGCINRESADAFNASATVPIFTTGQDSTTSASMTLSDGTACSASEDAVTDISVTTASMELYVIEITGNMDCNGQEITLDGSIETDSIVDLE
ncbi:MAG: hypothetical protein WBG86_06500 [Polyangiales bacterium]